MLHRASRGASPRPAGALFLAVSLAAAAAGCGGGAAERAGLTASVLETCAEIAHASCEDSLAGGRALRAAIDAPSEAALASAREAWLQARKPYGQTEACRFRGGPIAAADGPETLINA